MSNQFRNWAAIFVIAFFTLTVCGLVLYHMATKQELDSTDTTLVMVLIALAAALGGVQLPGFINGNGNGNGKGNGSGNGKGPNEVPAENQAEVPGEVPGEVPETEVPGEVPETDPDREAENLGLEYAARAVEREKAASNGHSSSRG